MLLLFGLQLVLVMKALVSAQDCSLNSTFNAPQSPAGNNLSNPFNPGGFPINKTCGWYIRAPENHIIKLQFALPLSKFPFVSVQMFDVFDADASDRSLINLVQFYPNITSRSQLVYILFKNSNKYEITEQIFARYTAFKTGHACSSQNSYEENTNILLRNPSGVIKTPGFPHGYTDSSVRDCFWKLIAPKGKVVRVEFLTFQIHVNDRVKITDDWNWWYPWYAERLESWKSFTVYSTGRELGIRVSGHRPHPPEDLVPGQGFIANYTMVPGDSSGTCVPKENSTIHLAGEGRSFSSPGYPANPGIGTCSWNITVPLGEFVKLTFWDFEGPCDQNYVDVFDVTNATRTFLGKACVGEYTHFNQLVMYSDGNNVVVRHSPLPTSDQNGGFTATYEALKVRPARYSCTNVLPVHLNDTRGGEFASFEYPLPYPNNVKCSWVIEAPLGYVIQLTFQSFAIQQSTDCQSDYVEVKQGFAESTPTLIGRFCGSALPPIITSKYYKVYVDFVTDSFERYPGFYASYTLVSDPAVGPCKLEGVENVIPMTAEAGRLFRPEYPPGTPPRGIMCTWLITVPDGHFVKLRLNNIELGTVCRKYSALAIRDGQSTSSPLVKSFCSYDIGPKTFFSSGRHLSIRFQSPKQDWSDHLWFTAEFEAVKQLPASYSCTRDNREGELNSETGILASYNFPLPYDDLGACDWKIRVSVFKRIELSFDFFNLSDPSPKCLDYVQIGNDELDNTRNIPRYCGSEKPAPFTSKGRVMWVWFWASGRTKYPGFKASYTTKLSTVGIVIIVAICLGVTIICALIGIYCFKHFKLRQRLGALRVSCQALYSKEVERVPLQEEAAL